MIGAFLLSAAAIGLVFASTIGKVGDDDDRYDGCITDTTPSRRVTDCIIIKEDRR